MNLRPEEISTLIKDQIKNYRTKIEPAETGTVILFGDGIAKAHGLRSCVSNELLEFDDGSIGIAQNLEEEVVSIAVLSDEPDIHEGTEVRRTGRIVSVPVGEALLGRVVHALGGPIDGKGPINCTETRPIEAEAPGIIRRKSVSVPLQTGIKAIDSMIPIGRGQRELIIGDRQTGKTSIAIDTIINQRGKNVICPRCTDNRNAAKSRRNGLHCHRLRFRFRKRTRAIHCSLFRLRNGRVFPRKGQGCSHCLR